jgi:hypothetical protein
MHKEEVAIRDHWQKRIVHLLSTENGNNNVRLWRNRTGQQSEEAMSTPAENLFFFFLFS